MIAWLSRWKFCWNKNLSSVYNIYFLDSVWHCTKLHHILFHKRTWGGPRTYKFILCRERYWKSVLYSSCRSRAVWIFRGKVWRLHIVFLIIKVGSFISHSQFIYLLLFSEFVIYVLAIEDSTDLKQKRLYRIKSVRF